MLNREQVVGQRIKQILGDSSLSDRDYTYVSFAYILTNGIAFHLPAFDDEFSGVEVSSSYGGLSWPVSKWWHYRRNLWRAKVVDVLIPADPDDRVPDSAVIKLSSGYFVTQVSGGPPGIADAVYLLDVDGH